MRSSIKTSNLHLHAMYMCVVGVFALCHTVPVHADPTPLELFERNIHAGAELHPGPLLIKIAPTYPDPDAIVTKAASELGCTRSQRLGHRNLFIVQCPEDRSTRAWLIAWHKQPAVLWVEADFYENNEEIPDDLEPEQWHHHNTGQLIDENRGLANADVASLHAWDTTTGDPSIIVAILDSGIYAQHEDLTNQLWENPNEDCTNGLDDDANGYVDDCVGWDVSVDGDNDPSPLTLPDLRSDGAVCRRWHGTFTAGLAGAQGNNGVGIAGISWNSTLMNVKKHPDSTCRTSTLRSVAAVAYALDAGARILVMSFSSPGYNSTLQELLTEADANNVIAIMSGGNVGESIEANPRYPVYYAMENRLVVTFSDNRDRLTSLSNWGGTRIDLAAPGQDLRSTSTQGTDSYEVRSGSSYATPLVAGAAALVWSAWPDLSAAQVIEAIDEGVEPIAGMDCAQTPQCVASGGRLDLEGAFEHAEQIQQRIETEAATTPPEPRSDDGCGCAHHQRSDLGPGWLVAGWVVLLWRKRRRSR